MTRRENDDYPTHSGLLEPLFNLKAHDGGNLLRGTVLEPAAGAGQLAKSLQRAGLQVVTNDVLPEYECNFALDAAEQGSWFRFGSFSWVVTNPPYKTDILEPILLYSLAYATRGVAMLLRLSALEPVVRRSKRGKILQDYQDNMRFLVPFSDPRPKYDPHSSGTDSVTTAWFVWDKGWSWKSMGLQSPFRFVTGWLEENNG